jgi:hypothetical protein
LLAFKQRHRSLQKVQSVVHLIYSACWNKVVGAKSGSFTRHFGGELGGSATDLIVAFAQDGAFKKTLICTEATLED